MVLGLFRLFGDGEKLRIVTAFEAVGAFSGCFLYISRCFEVVFSLLAYNSFAR